MTKSSVREGKLTNQHEDANQTNKLSILLFMMFPFDPHWNRNHSQEMLFWPPSRRGPFLQGRCESLDKVSVSPRTFSIRTESPLRRRPNKSTFKLDMRWHHWLISRMDQVWWPFRSLNLNILLSWIKTDDLQLFRRNKTRSGTRNKGDSLVSLYYQIQDLLMKPSWTWPI